MAHPGLKVPLFRGWRPEPGRWAMWTLDLAPANRDNPAWRSRLSVEGVSECVARVWLDPRSPCRFAWCVIHEGRDFYRDGECASRGAAQRRAETTGRKLGLRPARHAKPGKRPRATRHPSRRGEFAPSCPPPWVHDPLFGVVLTDDAVQLAAWEAQAGMVRADAVNWFMETCWGSAPGCRDAEPFPSDADRLAALRAAFRSEGISLAMMRC